MKITAETNSFFSKCTAKFKKPSLPEIQDGQTLEEICRSGAVTLGIKLEGEYEERLQFELKVIRDKELEPYFHLVGDLMRWARGRMSLGPGRGSSAGSLVCYLCGITRIDPIKENLLFFRFLDPARKDAADCDLDVADAQQCFEYLSAKYGHENVAKLGATGSFQASGATNEVAKQLALPRFEFNSLLDSLPKYAAGDSRGDKALAVALKETELGKRVLQKHPTFEYAGMLSGNPSHATTHAAGVLITKDSLSNYTAIDTVRKTAMIDLKDAEKLDVLKLDVLSLDTLLLFDKTLELAGLPRNFLDTIPLDDQAAFDVLNQGKTTGLFQLSGGAVKNLASRVKVTEINDIVALSALARPGPLSSGGAESWVKRRMGLEPVTYAHPIFEPYLKNTLGVFAYQESIMMIAREVGGLEWAQVNKLRKAIGKSMGPEAMREYGDPFISGCMSKGVPQSVAEKFWQDILGCGSYLFSLNHAVPYGRMSYYSCYLKAHYPLEFVAAALTLTKVQDKQVSFLKEVAAEGVGYIPYDPDLSTDSWRVVTKYDKKMLIGPLQNVKGLGPKSIQQVLGCRARGEPLPDALKKKLANAKTSLDSLSPIRDKIQTLNWKAHTIGKVTRLDQAIPGDGWDEFQVIGLVTKAEEQSENDERKVADRISRGQIGRLEGDPKSIQVRLKSDEVTDFLCKVTTKQLDKHRDYVLNNLEVGKSLVVVRGKFPPHVPCLLINEIEEIGRME